jgi:hypothetical protein
MGLLYRPASHCTTEAGGPVQQPYARVDYIFQSGTKNLATASRAGESEPLLYIQRRYSSVPKRGNYSIVLSKFRGFDV